MKTLILLLPGLTDVPNGELSGLTPLEKAKTPIFDEIAAKGYWSKILPPTGNIEKSLLELFSLESSKTHLAKSSLEVYANNYPFRNSDCVFAFQFISLFENKIVSTDPAILSQSELELLSNELNEKFGDWAQFIPIDNSSGVVILREYFDSSSKEKLIDEVLGKDWISSLPTFFNQKERVQKLLEIQNYLQSHPINLLKSELEENLANGLFFYDNGAPLSPVISKKFYEKYFFFTSSSASLGLANLLKIDVETYDYPETNNFEHLEKFIELVPKIFETKEIIVGEFQDLLQSTLSNKLLEKIKRIEFFDQRLLKPLLNLSVEMKFQIAVTPLKNSHITERKLIEGESPYILYNPQRKKGLEDILSFKESELSKIRVTSQLKSLVQFPL